MRDLYIAEICRHELFFAAGSSFAFKHGFRKQWRSQDSEVGGAGGLWTKVPIGIQGRRLGRLWGTKSTEAEAFCSF